ncbi:MAG: hypothetical protein OSB55_08330 [Verrucomicrobiota bacterium]|nr:hypothetical protein [Verrucomicrobiota bacterium]
MRQLLIIVIAVVLLTGCGTLPQSSDIKASGTVAKSAQPRYGEGACHTIESANDKNLSLEEIQNSRGLPHAYFGQGVDSIPLIHPHHRILVKRRNGQLGQTSYSLIVFLEPSTADEVDISGIAVADSKA